MSSDPNSCCVEDGRRRVKECDRAVTYVVQAILTSFDMPRISVALINCHGDAACLVKHVSDCIFVVVALRYTHQASVDVIKAIYIP